VDSTASPTTIACEVTVQIVGLDVVYSYFTPPLTDVTKTTLGTDTPWDRYTHDLATKLPDIARARNVYILKDGTVTDEIPAATYDSSGRLVSTGPERVRRTFYGGHEAEPIDADERAALVAAGWI